MLVKFTAYLVDSIFLGCIMFFKKGFEKMKHLKKRRSCHYSYKIEYINILGEKIIIFIGNWLKLFGKKYRFEICWGT